MKPTLVLRLEHAFIPGKDPAAARSIGEILTRPCFALLGRVCLETYAGRSKRHATKSAAAIASYLCDPECDVVDLDPGRGRELIAGAYIVSGMSREADNWEVYPAPLCSNVVVPLDPDTRSACMGAFLDLAIALRAIAGCVSTEMDYGLADKLARGRGIPTVEDALQQPGLSIRRLRERRAYDMRKLDRRIHGPEWGLFLSREHLRALPATEIEASGVFAEVHRLTDELVFLQLTSDPANALRADYDQLLDPAREVLAPLLMDISRITVE